MLHKYAECIQSRGQHFQHLVQFLIDFLNVFITAILCLAAALTVSTPGTQQMKQRCSGVLLPLFS
jgi:hypothetical protein